MKKVFVFLLLFFSFEIHAMNSLKLILQKNDNQLRVYIVNDGDQEIVLNKRFSLGSVISPSEINLDIKNHRGEKFGFVSKSNVGLAIKEDFISIIPGTIIGRSYSISRIVKSYMLKPGRYEVEANYNNHSGEIVETAFDGVLRSNSIVLEIDG